MSAIGTDSLPQVVKLLVDTIAEQEARLKLPTEIWVLIHWVGALAAEDDSAAAACDFARGLTQIAALDDEQLLEHGRDFARGILARHPQHAGMKNVNDSNEGEQA